LGKTWFDKKKNSLSNGNAATAKTFEEENIRKRGG
jgi:hypothetical protein